jgi:hypothetical protein
MTPKAQATKVKRDKLNLFKIKTFILETPPTKKVIRQFAEW